MLSSAASTTRRLFTAAAIESAVRRTLSDGFRTGDLMGTGAAGLTQVGTDGFRDAVLERLGTAVPA